MTHHIGVCGGANHFTNGEMAKIRARSVDEEIEKMDEYGEKMYQAIKKARSSANVSQYLVTVDEQNEYKGLTNKH